MIFKNDKSQSDNYLDEEITDLKIKILQLFIQLISNNEKFNIVFLDLLNQNILKSMNIDTFYFKLKS